MAFLSPNSTPVKKIYLNLTFLVFLLDTNCSLVSGQMTVSRN